MNLKLRIEDIIDSMDNNSLSYNEGVRQLMDMVNSSNDYYHLSKPWGDGIDTMNTAHNINTHNLPKENNEPFTKCPRCESDSVITYTCDHINCKECKCNFQYGFRNEKQK